MTRQDVPSEHWQYLADYWKEFAETVTTHDEVDRMVVAEAAKRAEFYQRLADAAFVVIA